MQSAEVLQLSREIQDLQSELPANVDYVTNDKEFTWTDTFKDTDYEKSRDDLLEDMYKNKYCTWTCNLPNHDTFVAYLASKRVYAEEKVLAAARAKQLQAAEAERKKIEIQQRQLQIKNNQDELARLRAQSEALEAKMAQDAQTGEALIDMTLNKDK